MFLQKSCLYKKQLSFAFVRGQSSTVSPFFFLLRLCYSAFLIYSDQLALTEHQILFLTKWNQGNKMTQLSVAVYGCPCLP